MVRSGNYTERTQWAHAYCVLIRRLFGHHEFCLFFFSRRFMVPVVHGNLWELRVPLQCHFAPRATATTTSRRRRRRKAIKFPRTWQPPKENCQIFALRFRFCCRQRYGTPRFLLISGAGGGRYRTVPYSVVHTTQCEVLVHSASGESAMLFVVGAVYVVANCGYGRGEAQHTFPKNSWRNWGPGRRRRECQIAAPF